MYQSINFQLATLIIVISKCLCMVVHAVPVNNETSALDFILLHNNDLHGRFDESSFIRTDCKPHEQFNNKCFGGFARISTVVKQYRNEHQNGNGPPVLFMNAGDTYTGTAWFFLFKDKIAAELMNALKPDVGALGNHEFDHNISGVVPYLNGIDFPMVISNLNVADDHPLWLTRSLQRSIVFNINGFKIGVIGYLLPETKNSSKVENVDFSPEIAAINKEASELEKNGVHIIIALGHSGYWKDQEIARDCPLVDVVVGGHTHSFLYTGTPPDETDTPIGPYPTVVVQKSGKQVPIVQAYKFSKYLGKLQLSFDKNGNLLRWSGLPILLDYKIPRDLSIEKLLDKYRPTVDAITNDVCGITKVDLVREDCVGECSMGNMIADSRVYYRAHQYNGSGWTDASIAILNTGSIRESAEIGEISRFTLTTVSPYQNYLMVAYVPGHELLKALEQSVELYDGTISRNFLQVSGLHIVYNVKKPPGQRVKSVDVLCSNCSVPVYEKLKMTQMYGVIIDTFLRKGGDGYTGFKSVEVQNMSISTLDATYIYIKHMETVFPAVEGRITFVDEVNDHDSLSKATLTISHPSFIILIASLLLSSQFSVVTKYLF